MTDNVTQEKTFRVPVRFTIDVEVEVEVTAEEEWEARERAEEFAEKVAASAALGVEDCLTGGLESDDVQWPMAHAGDVEVSDPVEVEAADEDED